MTSIHLSLFAGRGENSQVAMSKNVIRRKSLEPRSPAEADHEARDGGVQSVDRALSILETLAEDDEGYRLSDLAVRTGLSASTVHRLLATLESRRFVQFDRAESKWHVGIRSFTVGASFARRRNFSAQAIPYLRKLRDLTRETANLAVVGLWGFALWDYALRTHRRPERLPLHGASVTYGDAVLKRPYWPIATLDRWQAGLYKWSRRVEERTAQTFLKRSARPNGSLTVTPEKRKPTPKD